jgi:hypothetical protein
MTMARDTMFEQARNELFGFIHQCNVLDASDDQQKQWIDETIDYLASRHQRLSDAELDELRETAVRFCRPVIEYGKTHTALTTEGHSEAESQLVGSR